MNTDHFLLEVDHLVIYAAEGLSAVSVLQEFGLHRSHLLQRSDQGTASALFFFENTYLELIWVEDENKVRQYTVETGMDILSRINWKQTGASPFGIGLRHSNGDRNRWQKNSDAWVNFSSDNRTTLSEPICYTLPNLMALTTWLDYSSEEHRQLITHPLNIKKLTEIDITLAQNNLLTQAISLLEFHGLLSVKRGSTPLLTLTFDGQAQGQSIDVRPILPLVLKY
ncbi:MAG: VOC family protein [Cyanobacteria bacterium P01_G01_bin.49]